MRIRLIWRSIRSAPVLFIIPIVVVWVIVPLVALPDYRMGNPVESGRKLIMAAQALIPVVSLLWPMMYLQIWVEGEGKEALLASRLRKPSLCPEMLLFTGGVVTLLLPALFIIPASLGINPYEILRLAIQIAFAMGFVYFLAMMLNSVSMSTTVVIVYLLFSVLFSQDMETAPYCLLQPNIMIRSSQDLMARPIFTILAILSFPVGFLCERTLYRKF